MHSFIMWAFVQFITRILNSVALNLSGRGHVSRIILYSIVRVFTAQRTILDVRLLREYAVLKNLIHYFTFCLFKWIHLILD